MNAQLPSLPENLNLNYLPAGSQAQILAIGGALSVRRRLLEMGLCPGVVVDVIRRAPLGDPLEVRVRGYLLSLRLDQAAHVTVRVVTLAPVSIEPALAGFA